MNGSFGTLLDGEYRKDHKQKTVTTPCIALTKRQLREIEAFKGDLKANRVEFAFEGTWLETFAFLEGTKGIVEGFSH